MKDITFKKLKYYLDSSIINFVLADDEPKRRDLTKRLLEKLKRESFELHISTTVIDEINSTKDATLRYNLRGLIDKYAPLVLDVDKEVQNLSKEYLKQGIIPVKYEDDAIHIAVAVVNDLDVILSWNFEHIVKLKTRVEVNAINRILGYHEIEICSPEEVIEP